MRVLLVDDERLARQEMRRLLGRHPGWRVVGEARNVDEGVRAIEQLAPDIDHQQQARQALPLLKITLQQPTPVLSHRCRHLGETIAGQIHEPLPIA